MAWLRKEFKSVAIGVGLAIYVLVIATRPYISNPSLSHELIRLEHESTDARKGGFFGGGVPTGGRIQLGDIAERIQEGPDDFDVDAERARNARLNELLQKHGWPTSEKVGAEAERATWILVRRANDGGSLQRYALRLALQSGSKETAPDAAVLLDYLDAAEGKEQTYGTSYSCREGRVELTTPVRDLAGVEERRASVGLEPLRVGAKESIATWRSLCLDVARDAEEPPDFQLEPPIR